MTCLAPRQDQHRRFVGSHLPMAIGLLALMAAGPASAHSGNLTIQPATTIVATFNIGTPANGSEVSGPSVALAENVELNSSPQHILFGYAPYGRGLVISMADVAFSNPSVGSFGLTGWALDLVTPGGFPGAALAADGSFAMFDHDLRIDRGELSGNLIGRGPIQRNFSSDPLTLSQFSALTGTAMGDTGVNPAAIGVAIPFDHGGSLAALDGLSVEVLIQGRLVAEGGIEAIPEPSTALLLAFGTALLWVGRWRFQS